MNDSKSSKFQKLLKKLYNRFEKKNQGCPIDNLSSPFFRQVFSMKIRQIASLNNHNHSSITLPCLLRTHQILLKNVT